MRFIDKLRAFGAHTLNGFVENPKHLIKYVVLVLCSIVVVFQLSECFAKLLNPPIATHSFFNLNETMTYPALTFCHNPPYNPQQLRYYRLQIHPEMTNHWRDFNYTQHPDLAAVFENMTYGVQESVIVAGLDKDLPTTPPPISFKPPFITDIKIVSRMTFKYGLCHTMLPQKTTRGVGKAHGYSFNLRHDTTEDAVDGTAAGWDMFIHEADETFTEINMETSGRSERMLVRSNEHIEIKLNAQHFRALPKSDRPCRLHSDRDGGDNFNACVERCQWKQVAEQAQCSGPWMPGIQQRWTYCRDYESMRSLIVKFVNTTDFNHTACGCTERCESIIYTANVMSRQAMSWTKPSTTLDLYYASKMVTVYQERPGYDLNQFVSDIGGSLGFLLGLSVLGLIVLLEMVTVWLLKRCMANKTDEDVEAETADRRPKDTTTTTKRNDVVAGNGDMESGVGQLDVKKRAMALH